MSENSDSSEHLEPQSETGPVEEQSSGDASTDETVAAEQQVKTPSSGPLSLEKIRELRKSQQTLHPQQKGNRPSPPTAATQESSEATSTKTGGSGKPRTGFKKGARKPSAGESGVIHTPEKDFRAPKIAVPSRRQPLPDELEKELSAALGGSDLDRMLVGDEMLQVGHQLSEGQRLQGKVMKAHGEHVFVSLGGPNEGVLPALQFEELPAEGTQLDVVVRGYLADEGLYELTIPGVAVDVTDWSDLKEGEVVEALVTGANTGGLECKVGAVRGFIPASQVAEYRVEDLAEMVDQKVLCVISEANQRRGNLVLSRRAVLERERKEKREERLASLSVGDSVEGVVRKILDFGAFIDIGGLDGLLHVSQLSWERVNHPKEILEEGQKVQVRIEKIDEQTGKIGLSYRSLQDHPWTDIETRFPVGAVVPGSVTRIAEFGAFVRVATGVEGLVHVSELAHHRVQRVGNVVQEGQEVQVKVLSTDPENQRMSLSIKGAQAAPEAQPESTEEDTPPPQPVLPKHRGPLKGGTGGGSGGEQFGLRW